MSDNDRDRETVREERTTIVHTDGGRGGGGIIAAVVLILVVLVLAFLFFRGGFNRAADQVGLNVNLPATKVELPDVNVKMPSKIEIPEVKVKTEASPATSNTTSK
jgi:preprotein translocase subunit SecF